MNEQKCFKLHFTILYSIPFEFFDVLKSFKFTLLHSSLQCITLSLTLWILTLKNSKDLLQNADIDKEKVDMVYIKMLVSIKMLVPINIVLNMIFKQSTQMESFLK